MHYADTTADLPKENIEMTRNQVYGVPLTKGEEDIPMEENVGYGVTNQVCGASPLTAGTGQEAAADITMVMGSTVIAREIAPRHRRMNLTSTFR